MRTLIKTKKQIMVTPKAKSTCHENNENSETKAPDGGWGWVVVAGATVLNFLIGGAVNTFGVLYVALLDKYGQSAGATAWVGSLANAMGLLLGPLSSALSARFSCRKMVIMGGIFTSLGWVSTGFMPRIEYMFISYGLIAGIGKSLSFTPSILIVGQWFDKRRSLANGLSVAGAGFGTFAFAPLLETLLTKYGFTYTMVIMGGVMLVMSACGVLFRPVPSSCNIIRSPGPVNGSAIKEQTNACFSEDIDSNIRDGNETIDKEEENKTLRDYLDYTLMKNAKFFCFGISLMLATLGHSPASVMLPPLAQQHNVTAEKSAFLLSITGIADIIGRLCFGAICDIKALKDNRKYLYVASIFISGIANITCGFASQYWHFATYSVIFGLFAGSYNALTPVILVDLLSAEKLSSSFGLSLLFQGGGFLLGPPIAGWMRDGFGNYQSAFFFAGISMTISSLVINFSSVCERQKPKPASAECDEKLPTQENVNKNCTDSMLNDKDPRITIISVLVSPIDVSTKASPIDVSTIASPIDVSTIASPIEVSTKASPIDVSTIASPIEVSTIASPIDVSTIASPIDVSTKASPIDVSTTASPIEVSTIASPTDVLTNTVTSDADVFVYGYIGAIERNGLHI
ncbi:monocarboxylate transporter 12-like [Mercenaria mercenaria]|uniref:monocarboxylate transporter 12-like n=1 Tax=Mercenaria mercenaria TaxID=6596 RepID=UPI00234F572E|nr:monocarboxylate transporter 12-like [Mercenaria mercenaria]